MVKKILITVTIIIIAFVVWLNVNKDKIDKDKNGLDVGDITNYVKSIGDEKKDFGHIVPGQGFKGEESDSPKAAHQDHPSAPTELDAAQQTEMDKALSGYVEGTYADLYKDLNLSPEKKAKMTQQISQRKKLQGDFIRMASDDSISDEELLHRQKESFEKMQKDMEQVLDKEEVEKFKDYEKALPKRVFTEVIGHSADSLGISQKGKETLKHILLEEALKTHDSDIGIFSMMHSDQPLSEHNIHAQRELIKEADPKRGPPSPEKAKKILGSLVESVQRTMDHIEASDMPEAEKKIAIDDQKRSLKATNDMFKQAPQGAPLPE